MKERKQGKTKQMKKNGAEASHNTKRSTPSFIDRHRTAIIIVQIVCGLIAFPIGTFFLMFDGVCLGGAFCTVMPGPLAFFGALLMVFSISQFFLTSKAFRQKSLVVILTLIITVILASLLYGWRVSEYNHYKSSRKDYWPNDSLRSSPSKQKDSEITAPQD